MRLLVLAFSLVALVLPPPGSAAMLFVSPAADVGLPFWCSWGYDWEERCYSAGGARLPVGGVDDKVWRAALRFPVDEVPGGATITSAQLRLAHDGTCVGPRLRTVPCDGGSYWLDAHRIVSPDWFEEREVEFDERAAGRATLFDSSALGRLSFDLTALIQAWHPGLAPNGGVLVRLADLQEGYGASGPAFPSSSFPEQAVRRRLVVTYAVPSD
jgi:hypothetical protein